MGTVPVAFDAMGTRCNGDGSCCNEDGSCCIQQFASITAN